MPAGIAGANASAAKGASISRWLISTTVRAPPDSQRATWTSKPVFRSTTTTASGGTLIGEALGSVESVGHAVGGPGMTACHAGRPL